MPFTWTLNSEEVELVEDGKNIHITDENKLDFIEKVCDLIGYSSVKTKIDLLRQGFYSVINRNIIKIFNIDEFDFIISGQLTVDLTDWKENTIYKGHFNPEHKVSA